MKKILAFLICISIFVQGAFASRIEQAYLEERLKLQPISPMASLLNHRLAPFARLKKGSLSSGRPHVFILEDIHLNEEAQRNMAATLDILAQATPSLTVGVEGSSGEFDYRRFRASSTAPRIKKIADLFVKEGRIGAVSLAGLTLPDSVFSKLTIKGVEQPDLYSKHVASYRKAMDHHGDVEKKLKKIDEQLTQEALAQSGQIKDFRELKISYREGRLSLGEYAIRLARAVGDENVPLGLETFLTAYELERSIDFSRAQAERGHVLSKLAPLLSKQEEKTLLELTQAFQTQHLSPNQLYYFLTSLFSKYRLSLSSTPAFRAYLQYLSLADSIEAARVMTDLALVEKTYLKQLKPSAAEMEFLNNDRWLGLANKLITFSLTPEEWSEYRSLMQTLQSLRRPGMLLAGGQVFPHLSPFEDFYRCAEERNHAMVAQLGREKTSVVVAGGFHTPGMLELLKEQGYSTAVLTPRISRIETASGTQALRYFLREKSPLEKLFSGRKLFLALPEGIGPLAPQIEAPPLRTEASPLFFKLAKKAMNGGTPFREWAWASFYATAISVTFGLFQHTGIQQPLWLALIVISVVLHEWAHAWTAVYLGDNMPRAQGRLTLNLFKHWKGISAKPVEFDARRPHVRVYLAGPALNLALALTGWIGNILFNEPVFFEAVMGINIFIAGFNLLVGDGVQAALLAYQKIRQTSPPYQWLRPFLWQRWMPFRLSTEPSVDPKQRTPIQADIETYRETTLHLLRHIKNRDIPKFQADVQTAIQLAQKIRDSVGNYDELRGYLNDSNSKRIWPTYPDLPLKPLSAAELWILGNKEDLSQEMRNHIAERVHVLFDSFPEDQREDIQPFKEHFELVAANGETILLPSLFIKAIRDNRPFEEIIARFLANLNFTDERLIPDHIQLDRSNLCVVMQPRSDKTQSSEIALHETIHGLCNRQVLLLPSSSELMPMAVSMLELLRHERPTKERFNQHGEEAGLILFEAAQKFAESHRPGEGISEKEFLTLIQIVSEVVIEHWEEFEFSSQQNALLNWTNAPTYAERKVGVFVGMVFHHWYGSEKGTDTNPFPALRHLIEYANTTLAKIYGSKNFEPVFFDKEREKRLTTYLTEEVQSLTGLSKLRVKPWKANSPTDQPHWRFTPQSEKEVAFLEYPVQEFFDPDEAITKMKGLAQAIVVLQRLKTTFIAEESNSAEFQLFWGVAYMLLAEKELLMKRLGLEEVFDRLVLKAYPNPKNPAARERMKKQPAYIQYLEGVMFNARKKQSDPRIDSVVAEKIKETRPAWDEFFDQETILQQAKAKVRDQQGIDPERNPALVQIEQISISLSLLREKIWPVFKKLLDEVAKESKDQTAEELGQRGDGSKTKMNQATKNLACQLGGAGQGAREGAEKHLNLAQHIQNLHDKLTALGGDLPAIKDQASQVAVFAHQLGQKAKEIAQEGNGNRGQTANTMQDLAQQLATAAEDLKNKTHDLLKGVQNTSQGLKAMEDQPPLEQGANAASDSAAQMDHAAGQVQAISGQMAEAAQSLLNAINQGSGEDKTETAAKSQGIDRESGEIESKAQDVGSKADDLAATLSQLSNILGNILTPPGEIFPGPAETPEGSSPEVDRKIIDEGLLSDLNALANTPAVSGGNPSIGNTPGEWAERLNISPEWAEHWVELRQAAMPLVATLKNKWAPYFESLITEGKEGRQISGKSVDQKNIAHILIDGRALERTTAPDSLTVLLEMILDMSGSMGGPYADEKKLDMNSPLVQTTIAFIAQAMAFIELNRNGKWRDLLHLDAEIRAYAAEDNIKVFSFGQKLSEKELAQAIGKLFSSPLNRRGTADTPTLRNGSESLRKRAQGERAITLVIHGTDGNVPQVRDEIQAIFNDPANKNVFYFTAGVGGGESVGKVIKEVYESATNPRVFWTHVESAEKLRSELVAQTEKMIKKATAKVRKAHDWAAPLLVIGVLVSYFLWNGFPSIEVFVMMLGMGLVGIAAKLTPPSQAGNPASPPYAFEEINGTHYFTMVDKWGQKVRLPIRPDTTKFTFNHQGVEWQLERHRISINRPNGAPRIYGEWLGEKWIWYEQQADGTTTGLAQGPPADLGLVFKKGSVTATDTNGLQLFSASLANPQVWEWTLHEEMNVTPTLEKYVPTIQQVFREGRLVPNQILLTVEGIARVITLTPTFVNQLADMMEVLSRTDPASTNLALTGDKSTGKNTAVYVLAGFLRQPVRTMSLHEDINEIDLLWKTTVGLFKPGTTDLFLSEYADAARVGDWIVVDEATKPRRIGSLTALNTINQNRRLRLPDQTVIQAAPTFRAMFLWNPPNGLYVGQSMDNVSDFLSRLSGISFSYPTPEEETDMLMASFENIDTTLTKEHMRNLTMATANVAAQIRAYAASPIGQNANIPPMDGRQIRRTLQQVFTFPDDLAYLRDILLMDYPLFLLAEEEQEAFQTKMSEWFDQFFGRGKFNQHYMNNESGEPTIDPGMPRVDFDRQMVVFGDAKSGVPEFPIARGDLPLSEAEVLEFLDTPTNRLDLYQMAKAIYLGYHYAVIGEKGTGKTESILYLYKGLLRQRLVQPPQITENIQGDDILGVQHIVDGKSHFPQTPLETSLVEDRPINFSEFTKGKQSALAALNNVMEYMFQSFTGGRTARAKAKNRKFHIVFDGNPATGSTQSNALSAEFASRVRIFQRRPLKLKQLQDLIRADEKRLKKEAVEEDFDWHDLDETTITALAQCQLNLMQAYRASELGAPPDYRQIHRLIQKFGRYPLRLLEAEEEYLRELIITDPDHRRVALRAVHPLEGPRLRTKARNSAQNRKLSPAIGEAVGLVLAGLSGEKNENEPLIKLTNEHPDLIFDNLIRHSTHLLTINKTVQCLASALGGLNPTQRGALERWVRSAHLHDVVSQEAREWAIEDLKKRIRQAADKTQVHDQVMEALCLLASPLVDMRRDNTITALPNNPELQNLALAFSSDHIQATLEQPHDTLVKALGYSDKPIVSSVIIESCKAIRLFEMARELYPKPEILALTDILLWLSPYLGSDLARLVTELLIEILTLKFVDEQTLRQTFEELKVLVSTSKPDVSSAPTFNWNNYTVKTADVIPGLPRNGDSIPGMPGETWKIQSSPTLSADGTKMWVMVSLDNKAQMLELDRNIQTGQLSKAKAVILNGTPIPGLDPGKTWDIRSSPTLSADGSKMWVMVSLDNKRQILELDRDIQTGQLSNAKSAIIGGTPIPGLEPEKIWDILSAPTLSADCTKMWVWVYLDNKRQILELDRDIQTGQLSNAKVVILDGTPIPGLEPEKKWDIRSAPTLSADGTKMWVMVSLDNKNQIFELDRDIQTGQLSKAKPVIINGTPIPGLDPEKTWDIYSTPTISAKGGKIWVCIKLENKLQILELTSQLVDAPKGGHGGESTPSTQSASPLSAGSSAPTVSSLDSFLDKLIAILHRALERLQQTGEAAAGAVGSLLPSKTKSFNWNNYTVKTADDIPGLPRNGDPIPSMPEKKWAIWSSPTLSADGTKMWVWVYLDNKRQILELDRNIQTGQLSNAKPYIIDGTLIPGLEPEKKWDIRSSPILSVHGTKMWVWVYLDNEHQILELDRNIQTGQLSNAKPYIIDGTLIPGLEPEKIWDILSAPTLSADGTKMWVWVYLDNKRQMLELDRDIQTGQLSNAKVVILDGTPIPGLDQEEKWDIWSSPTLSADGGKMWVWVKQDNKSQILECDRDIQTGQLSNAKPFIIDGTPIPGLDPEKTWNIYSTPTISAKGEKMWVQVQLDNKPQILELTSQSVDSQNGENRGDSTPSTQSASPSSVGPSAPTVSSLNSFFDKLIALLNQAFERLHQTSEAAAGAVGSLLPSKTKSFNWNNYTVKTADDIPGLPRNGDSIPGMPGETWKIQSSPTLSADGTKMWVRVKLNNKDHILELDRDIQTGQLSNAKSVIIGGTPIPGLEPEKKWDIGSSPTVIADGTKMWVRVKLDNDLQILELDRDIQTGQLSNAKSAIIDGTRIPGLDSYKKWAIQCSPTLSADGTKVWVWVYLDYKHQILELDRDIQTGELSKAKSVIMNGTPIPGLGTGKKWEVDDTPTLSADGRKMWVVDKLNNIPQMLELDRDIQTGELSNAKAVIINGTSIPGLDKRSKRKKWDIQSAPTVIVDGEKMWVMVYLEKKLQILELTSQLVDAPKGGHGGESTPSTQSASPLSAGSSAPTVSSLDSFFDKLIALLNQALERLHQTSEAAAGAVGSLLPSKTKSFNWNNYTVKTADDIPGLPRNGDPIPGMPEKKWDIRNSPTLSADGTKMWVRVKLNNKDQILELDREVQTGALSNAKSIIINGTPIPGLEPEKKWDIWSVPTVTADGTKMWVMVSLDNKNQILELDRNVQTGELSNAKPYIIDGTLIPGLDPGKKWAIWSRPTLSADGRKMWVVDKLNNIPQMLELDRDIQTGILSNAKPVIINGTPIPGLDPEKTWDIWSSPTLSADGTKMWVMISLDNKNQILELDRNVQTGELSNAKPYIIDGTLIPGLDKRSKRKKWEIQSAPTVIVDGEKMWVMVYLEKKLQILELTSQSVDSPGAEIRGDFQPNARSASPSSAGPSAPTVSPPDSFLDKLITLLNQALDRLQQTGEAAAGAVATSVSKGVVASKRVYYPLDVDKLSAMGSNAIQSVEDDIGAPVLSVAVSPNGEYLAVGTAQIWTARNNTRQEIPGRIVMFQRSDGNLIKVKEFVSHKGDVNSVAFSPTGDRILSGSDDSTLKLWDVTATPDAQNVVHDSLKTFKGHTYAVMSVAFSPKGDRLVSGSLDWSLKLWDINATSVNGDVSDFLVSFESQADITAVAFSPNGDRIVSGSEDGTLKLWNASASLDAKSVVSEPLAKFIGHSDKINSVVFNPKGDRIASGSIDKTIMMWDAKPAKVEVTQPLVSFHEHLNNVNSVAFHPHGDILVSGSEDGRLKLWDALAQPDARGIVSKSLATFEGHRATVWSAIFDPEGKHILSGGMDRTVRQWTLPTLSTPMELPIIPMRGENALGLAQPPLPHNSLRLLENLLVFLTAMKTKIQRPLPPPSGDANEVDVAPSSGFFFFPVMGDLPIELLLVGVVILYGPGLLRIFNQWSRLWRRGPVFSQSSWPEIEPHGLEDWGALSFERQLASPKPSQQLMIVQVNNRTDVEKTIQAHEKMKEEQRKKQALVMVGPEELTAQVGDHLLIDQRQLLDNGGDLSLSSVIQTALMSPSQSLESFKKAFAGGDLEIVLSIRDAHWTVGEAVQWKGRLYNMESIPLKIFLRETLVQWFLDNPSKPQTLDQFFKSLKASALAA